MQESNAKLLIIASSVEKARPAANYLNRRGVGCGVVSSVRASLDFIRQYKPEYVMLSWNLPGTNVLKIMEILKSTFQVTVILFSESQDSKTATQLNGTNHKHILHAPVSGTKIQIKLTQIEREREMSASGESVDSTSNEGSASRQHEGAKSNSDNDKVIIKSGSKNQPNRPNLYMSKKGGRSEDDVSYMGKGDACGGFVAAADRGNLSGDNDLAFRDGETLDGSAEIAGRASSQKGAETEASSEAWPELSSGLEGENTPEFPDLPEQRRGVQVREGSRSAKGLKATRIEKDQKLKSRGIGAKGEFPTDLGGSAAEFSNENDGFQENSEREFDSENLRRSKGGLPGGLTADRKGSLKRHNQGSRGEAQNPPNKNRGISWQQASPNSQNESASNSKFNGRQGAHGSDRNRDFPDLFGEAGKPSAAPNNGPFSGDTQGRAGDAGPLLKPEVAGRERECLLAQAVTRALQQVVVPDGDRAEISEVRQLQVMTIQSPRYNGYLLAARSGDVEIDDRFLADLRKAILTNLEVVGEKVTGEKLDFTVCVRSFPFIEWAGGEAEFFAKAQHGATEVAMAFVAGPDAIPDFSSGLAIEGMSAVDLKMFPEEEAVEFDVFLFMPLNNKFFKYVKKGLKLLDIQKARLAGQKILQVFVRVKDRKKLSVAYGKKFIRGRIERSENHSLVVIDPQAQRPAA